MAIHVQLADDAERFLQTDCLVWADGRSSLSVEEVLSSLRADQRFAARTDDDADLPYFPGVYGVYDLTLSVPGPRASVQQIPVAGLTWVGVHPDQRRRGVLTSMIRDHLERTAEAEASGISVLHASEPVIYGRFGYGVASTERRAAFGKGTKFTAPGLEHEVEGIRTVLVRAQGDGVQARVRAAAEHAAQHAHGQVVRDQQVYQAFALEAQEEHFTKEPLHVLLAVQDGVDVGYALLRRAPKWENDQADGTLTSRELVGSPAAQLALIRRLVDFDLMAKTEVFGRGRDDLLQRWSADSRGTHSGPVDSLWVRLVDLPRAMAARGYAHAGDLVLEVADDFLPDQGGRWRLLVGDDGVGRAERTDASPDLSLTTQQLAGAYLGDGGLPQLVRAGLVTEHRDGAAVELDALLGMPVPPSAAVGF